MVKGSRTAAHILTGFDGDLMGIKGIRARQSTRGLEEIHNVILRNNVSNELETLLRKYDLCLVAQPRCTASSGRGWRCKRVSRNGFGSYCVKCRYQNKERSIKLYASRMVRDSVRNDNKKLMQRQFIRCENCKVPMLKKVGGNKSKLRNWCYECKHLRKLGQYKRFREANGAYKHDAMEQIMVHNSSLSDKSRAGEPYDFRKDPNYIKVSDIKCLRVEQNDKCYFCNIPMNTSKRNKSDGMTIERLDEGPHWASRCVLSCGGCNRRSWRPGWCPFPWKTAKVLDLTPVDGYLKNKTTLNRYVNLKNVKRWYLNDTIQSTIANHLPSRLCVRRQARMLEELRRLPRFALCQ